MIQGRFHPTAAGLRLILFLAISPSKNLSLHVLQGRYQPQRRHDNAVAAAQDQVPESTSLVLSYEAGRLLHMGPSKAIVVRRGMRGRGLLHLGRKARASYCHLHLLFLGWSQAAAHGLLSPLPSSRGIVSDPIQSNRWLISSAPSLRGTNSVMVARRHRSLPYW